MDGAMRILMTDGGQRLDGGRFNAHFFAQFTRQGRLEMFARIHLAPGKFPPSGQNLAFTTAGHQHATAAGNHAHSD